MSTESHELALYAENNGDLFRQRTEPVIKNLAFKKVRGVYDPQKALILWKYVADDAAQRYTKEFDVPNRAGSYGIFTPSMRRETAEELAEYYAEYVDIFFRDHPELLPKKYRHKNPSRRSVHTKKWDNCVRDVKRKGEAADPYAVCTASLGYRGSVKAQHRRSNPVNGFLLSVKNTSSGQRAYYTGEEPEAFDSNKSRGKIYATAAHARAAAAMLQRDKHLKPGWRYAVVVASRVNPASAPAEKLYTDFHGEPPKSVKEHVLPEFSEGLEIGPVAAITYDTIRDGKKIRFEHEFAKRAAPLLITNGRTLALTGGRYRFTDRGIVDRAK